MSIRYSRSDGNNQPASDIDEESPYPAAGNLEDDAPVADAPVADGGVADNSVADGRYADAPDSTVTEADIPTRPTFTARTDSPSGTVPSPATAPDDTEADYAAPDGTAGYDETAVAGTVVDEPAVTATQPDLGSEPGLGPDDAAYAGPETGVVPADDAGPLAQPAAAQAVPVPPAQAQSSPAAASPTAVLNEPLLSDADGLRQQWQQVQAEFVDDPQEAVGHAADLIEQTTQTLVETLRQRQQDLRAGWDANDESGTASANVTADTERLRQMMRSYRALFDQLTRP